MLKGMFLFIKFPRRNLRRQEEKEPKNNNGKKKSQLWKQNQENSRKNGKMKEEQFQPYFSSR